MVTGATGGIGEEFARLFAQRGRRLILTGRRRERLETVAALLHDLGSPETAIIEADLSLPGAAAALHAECHKRGLVVETLVNNAGSGLFGPAAELAPEKVEAMIALNVTSLTTLSTLFGRDMAALGKGAILNVGSIAGKAPMAYFASYGASKAYVHSFSLALRAELKSSGVVVSCLLPGYVRTAFDDNAGVTSRAYKAFSSRNAMDAARVAAIGLRALDRGGAIVIAGGTNKFAASLMALLPASLLPGLMKPFLDRLRTRG